MQRVCVCVQRMLVSSSGAHPGHLGVEGGAQLPARRQLVNWKCTSAKMPVLVPELG